ncbi:hypothetical protein VQ643_14990 [Pseudomonas sp. F1_0610]|uniref:hypothetical protein n=1 Tax=Pseudomonas sp. F1_0610 TaxID=3114284 RepID=UPI0039C42CF7
MKRIPRIVARYKALAEVDENFESYFSFYLAMCKFIDGNKQFFKDNLKSKWGLDILMKLDFQKYILESPDLSLVSVRQRIKESENLKSASLPMLINSYLWDLVRIYSDEDCTRCGNSMAYVKAIEKNKKETIVLECTFCGAAKNLDGTTFKTVDGDFVEAILPVTQDEILLALDQINLPYKEEK